MDFTLELLHFAEREANTAAVYDAPRVSAVLNALRAQDLGAHGIADNTLPLSSGGAMLPGVFLGASEDIFGSVGIADIQIQNELGVQAMALDNRECDQNTDVLAASSMAPRPVSSPPSQAPIWTARTLPTCPPTSTSAPMPTWHRLPWTAAKLRWATSSVLQW
ncbi:hypothetical protein J4E08_06895 [Sagittula sp. NFXS13]|uniref:hypothetical protein n=1 Tax=Sagittula sp. NFXS13 TaxID=2819095 RepID=UPI0032DF4DE4